jgi:hypothetical protein
MNEKISKDYDSFEKKNLQRKVTMSKNPDSSMEKKSSQYQVLTNFNKRGSIASVGQRSSIARPDGAIVINADAVGILPKDIISEESKRGITTSSNNETT